MTKILLRQQNSHCTSDCTKTGYIEIADLGNGFYEANIEIELIYNDDSIDAFGQYIPLSKEMLKPLYDSLKAHFKKEK